MAFPWSLIVLVVVSSLQAAQAQEFSTIRDEFPCYRNLEGTYATMRHLEQQAAQDSSLSVEMVTIGQSYEGREIFGLEITGNGAEVEAGLSSTEKGIVFITAGMHAREYPPPELVLRWAELMVNGYLQGEADIISLLDHTQLHLIIQTNPDGRLVAETESLPNRRKNSHVNLTAEATLSDRVFAENRTCYNQFGTTSGVDLNRNFRVKWGQGGSSLDPCAETFMGYPDGPEPEVLALTRYAERVFPAAQQRATPEVTDTAFDPETTRGVYIDVHSYGSVILWPWVWDHLLVTPNDIALKQLARRFSDYNGYGLAGPLQPDSLGIRASGTGMDWFYAKTGAASFLFEVGNAWPSCGLECFYLNCDTFQKENLDGNLQAFTHAAKVSRQPYKLGRGPTVDTIAVTSAQLDGALQATIMAHDFPALTVDRLYVTIDMHPDDRNATGEGPYRLEIGNVLNLAGASGARAQGVLSVSVAELGLQLGAHTLYAYGLNSAGFLGPVTAASFEIVNQPPGPAPTLAPVSPLATMTPTAAPALCKPKGKRCRLVGDNKACCDGLACGVDQNNRTRCRRCKEFNRRCTSTSDCCGPLVCTITRFTASGKIKRKCR